MDEKFRKELEADGWRIGTVQEFLGLTDEEAAYIEIRHQLRKSLRARRAESSLTQEEFAKRIGSSQSRVAKVERGDPSVSIGFLIRGLLALGATVQEIGAIISAAEPPKPLNRIPEVADGSAAAAD
jgi:DNA-binding XRE family transcriptional regulator